MFITSSVGVDVDASATFVEVSAYLFSGVTGWLPTTVPASDDNYARVVNAISSAMQSDNSGAHGCLVFYEGPLNASQCGALHELFQIIRHPQTLTVYGLRLQEFE